MKRSLLFLAGLFALTGCGFFKGVKQFDTASYTTKPGIDYACPHDGKHGDDVRITVEHNGRKATQTLAVTELLEKRPDLVAETAAATFAQTVISVPADSAERPGFAKWMARVYRAAPRFNLTLHPNDARLRESEEEWFYLYYWQSARYSVERAISETKVAWAKQRPRPALEMTWLFSYKFVQGPNKGGTGVIQESAFRYEEALTQFRKDRPGVQFVSAIRVSRKASKAERGRLSERSFYDASNPQPRAFYDWMDKVSVRAYRADLNIDGDENYFIRYWRRGFTPSEAICHFKNDPWPNNGGNPDLKCRKTS